MKISTWLALTLVPGAALSACSLAFPGSDYVSEAADTTAGSGGSGGANSGGANAGGGGLGGAPGVAARVFVAGGDRDKPASVPGSFDTNTYDVIYADVRLDGSFSPWNFTFPLPVAGAFRGFATTEGVFLLGRSVDVDSYDRAVLLAAPLTQNGVGSWLMDTDDDLHDFSSVATVLGDGHGYLLGGYATAATGSVEVADAFSMPADLTAGLLSARQALSPLSAPRRYISSLIHNGYIYAVGGSSSNTARPPIDTGKIEADGSLSWAAPVDMPGEVSGTYGVHSAAVCASGNMLYIAGGTFSGGRSDLVLTAELDAQSGEPSNFRYGAKLPAPLNLPNCFVVGRKLYVVGGEGNSSRYAEIRVSELDASGLPGAFETLENADLPYARSDVAIAVVAFQ